MKVRNATISDVNAIYSLINSYAEQDKMLFRSKADIYENLQLFSVVEENDVVTGCCALQIIWSDLAEIKSLAVDEANKGTGVGTVLIAHAIDQTRKLGVKSVFALTLEPNFFCKMGFEVIDKKNLPMKVWKDCARCPKQQNCDEIAVVCSV